MAGGYAIWRARPIWSILITSLCANLVTQAFLWLILSLFFQHYLIALLVAEIVIWIVESLALYYIPANYLRFSEAVVLSLGMNMMSFALGWLLPI